MSQVAILQKCAKVIVKPFLKTDLNVLPRKYEVIIIASKIVVCRYRFNIEKKNLNNIG